MPQPKHDISALKAVPILQVAQRLGVNLVRTGGDTYQERAPEGGVASLTVFVRTNSFVRFSGKERGGCSKGSTIDFVRHVRDNASVKEACEFLSEFL